MTWGGSSNAAGYEFCYDMTDDAACDGTWTNNGTSTSRALSGLTPNTTYYWQVRGLSAAGVTSADGATWWRFTTAPLPGAFGKTTPANAATGLSLSPTVTWGSSSGATGYEYCYDMTDDAACDGAWTSSGTNTSRALSGLSPNMTYYWQVRGLSPAGATSADGATWWRFTTAPPPGVFAKTTPANAATGLPLSLALTWSGSRDATGYEYCYDTTNNATCDRTWISVGTDGSVTLSGLNPNTTYYWQVRGLSPAGTTYADGGSWRYFRTASLPGVFGKTAPANAATGLSLSPTLTWGSSSNATDYEFCYDTTNNATCDDAWISAGTNGSVTLSGLTPNTTYYWQVRGLSPAGTTSANSSSWWYFRTAALPGVFGKTAPANAATDLPLSPTVTWGSSSNATGYEFCYDTTDNAVCDGPWTSSGTSTSRTLSGLNPNTTYYWQVRGLSPAGTLYADSATWWRFTTAALPGVFGKTTPANAATVLPLNPTLTWGDSRDAAGYEFCYDTTNNATCDGAWTNTGTHSSVTLSGLSPNTIYYWQVRGLSPAGTTSADGATWWYFRTASLPGVFSKTAPANAATGLPLSLALIWSGSSNATGYEYCYDTTNNATCDGIWTSAGANGSVTLSGLSPNMTYYWQVRGLSPAGTTAADGGSWRYFRTAPLPGVFGKTTPANAATGLSLSPTLTWSGSSNAAGYEFCYDTTDDAVCDGTWTSNGTSTSRTLSGLNPNTTYYWQARGLSPAGTTYADGGSWRYFRTAPLPGAFGKTAPANGATGLPVSPTLTWSDSRDAAGYEYCYDTTNNTTCDRAWTSAGTHSSVTLSGLNPNTTYYWQVRGLSPAGTTSADGATWWYFRTAPLPGVFGKTIPANGATGLSLNPTLTWSGSSNATGYEFCYDTVNNATCDRVWTSVGTDSSVTLSGLNPNTTYYWQVRGLSPAGATSANSSSWWYFRTAPLPGAFGKTAPTNGATGLSLSPTLTWGGSSNATGYEYCYDTTDDAVCDGTWTSSGTSTSRALSGLTPNTTYYWQARANGPGGTTYADGATWRRFTTAALPSAFGKTTPGQRRHRPVAQPHADLERQQ